MGIVQWCKGVLVIVTVCMAIDMVACNAEVVQRCDERCNVATYCRCPGGDMFMNDSCVDQCAMMSCEHAIQHRCAKCDERKKQERAKLAQTIIANVAQFFQGMVALANSGKEADDKVKTEQCLLMAQAVGNLIYQAHEHHRCGDNECYINKGALTLERKNALTEKLYNYIRYGMADFIVHNPEYCINLLADATMDRPSATT